MANFISSITLQFKDAFSPGFTQAKNSFAGMKDALDDLNKNSGMFDLAKDVAAMTALTGPFRQKLPAMMDEPSRLAGAFDTAFRNVAVATGASGAELAALNKELVSIGGKTAAGPQKVAAAFAGIARGVNDASARMAVMNAAVSPGEANRSDLGAAAGAMVNVMNAWSLSADGAAIAADAPAQSAQKGNGSFDEFASSMSHISTVAASAGIGLDELGASMAYATTKGMSATQSSKQLKGIIGTLMSPGENLAKVYKSLGVASGAAPVQEYGLAESLTMLKSAAGGNEEKFRELIGNQEAAAVAAALTCEAYRGFAGSFASGMDGVTKASRKVQTKSYEAKVARLTAATDAMKIQIGAGINAIKGVFVDMGAGFLTHVAAPILSSPAGGFFQGLAAGVGFAAKGILDLGGNALNTASRLVTFTAAVQNAGGFAKLFGSSLSLCVQPFKAFPRLLMGAIPALGAFGAAAWAAIAPLLPIILPVVAVVAALSLAGVLLYKNWIKVKEFFVSVFTKIQSLLAGVSNKALVAVAAFFPFTGIPALIIKNRQTIKAFFVGLWARIVPVCKGAFAGIKNFFISAWSGIKDFLRPSGTA